MKIREGFRLRSVAGAHIVIGVGPAASFHGIVRLNDTAAFLFEKLCAGATRAELTDALCAAYAVDADRAGADVDALAERLRAQGMLDA